jgi:hypothetical protein
MIFETKIDKIKFGGLLFSGLLLFFVFSVSAAKAAGADTDGDGVNDYDETVVYHTNPNNHDTDGDGYNDKKELIGGFSPWEKTAKKLEETDFDKDGLTDRMELNFHCDPTVSDSDGDGHPDGAEIKAGYDPASSTPVKLKKRLEVNLAAQTVSYFLGDVRLGKFLASSGVKSMPTPKGTFTIANKNLKAWSSYGLWMPYWMGLKGQRFGLHELPYWPNGRREGESSLGHPASHGCVRVGRNGEAKTLYEFAEIGTPVIIN